AVWVNPKSRLRVEIPDTIFCDSSRIVFNLHTLNGKVLGNKAYNLRKSYDTDSIHSTLEAKDYGINNPATLSDTLINKTASYQVIRYTFTPYIEDSRPGYGAHRCYQDKDTSIVVYVNPLPSMKVEAQDTLCNETAVKFNISSRNGSVKGDKMYYLTTLQPDSMSGSKITGTYPVGNFTDTLINHSPHLKTVAYHFIAQIKDNRPGHNDFCLIGRDTTLNLRVNPTPGISSWAIRDSVCFQEGSILHVSTPNTNTGQWAYDVHSSSSDLNVTGFRQATDTSVFSFTDSIRNNSDTVQYVYYQFVPSILHPSSKIVSCESGIADTTVVMVAPKIVLALRKDTVIGGWSVSCNGSTNGKIHLGARGGYHPAGYLYSWSRSTTGSDGFNVSSQNQSNVRSGLYTAMVTDNIGCKNQDTIRLKQPPALVTEIVRQKDISCAAHSDGALRAKVNGGTPAYRLSWAGPNHTSWGNVYTIYNLPEGPYTLTAVDTNKCVSTYSMKFTSPADVTSALNPTPVTCFGGNNGTFSPVFGGGSTIVSYSWTGPEGYSSSRRNIEQLRAGFYKLKVTNSDGCYYEFGDSIKQPFKISATIDTSYYPPYNISCYGSTDGFIKLSQIRGGRGNQYKYEWADNSDTSFITGTTTKTNLPAGIFYIKMIDTAKCSVIDTISLHQPDSLILNNQISDYHGRQISCAGQEDGFVHLSPSGGFGTYTYSWTGPGNAALKPNEQNQDRLIAGQYNLTLTYGGRCTKNWTFNLTEPQKLKLNPVISDYSGYAINCQGYNSGSVHLNATGGTPEYIYDWQTNGGSGLVNGDSLQDKLTAGAYSVVVNDLNNCSVRDTFLLQQPDSMKVSSWSTDMTCNPGNDGTITITPAGGVSPYVYNWGDGSEGSKHTGLSAGIYHIQVS
ncbi:MAG: SprB repeat-containing protein, partial [Bacteroidota bacterium]|nr:SprB repeat-containing protein [Bacteroidota bacterium]